MTKSLQLLSKRGPDRQAHILTENAHLGHSRLSILDTSSQGDQPMQDPSGRYTLVFNGEIYNYRTIADQLRKKGVNLRSSSDSEVILHLLIHEGLQALTSLNGFFAFAFHDAASNESIIARDRMGIKPLYYAKQEDSLLFASELKAIAPLLNEKRIDRTAVALFFRFNYVPQDTSIYQDVQQLLPGHYISIKQGKTQVAPYFSIKQGKRNTSDNLHDLLDDAVRMRLVSDVPLGSFLSGGIDSSIIAALAARHKPSIRTFSIGFKDNSFFDESAYAELVAKHIGSDHLTIQLHEEDMLQHVEHVLDYVDEPFADSSAIAVHALSQHTKEQVTVALSGDGADELFGGYNKHQAHLAALAPTLKERIAILGGKVLGNFKGGHEGRVNTLLRQSQRFAKGVGLKHDARYWAWASWTSNEELAKLLAFENGPEYESLLSNYAPKGDSLEEVLLADTRWVLPNDMLCKVDRMSMANSLEVRVPFLDHRIVEFAHGLSAAERCARGRGKHILETEFSKYLPKEIFDRKKKGFEVPLEKWFLGPLQEKLMGVLSDGVLVDSGLFHHQALMGLQDNLRASRIGDKVHLLWALMVFHRFYSRLGH